MIKIWKVEVIELATGLVVKTVECKSELRADLVERGMFRNMNLEEYSVHVVEPEPTEEPGT